MPDTATNLEAPLLVVGGGIAGMTAAIEASEAGLEVVLLEREATLGGRVAKLFHYFPKLCPPSCGLEINFRRLRENPNVTVFTLADVDKIEGEAGNYTVTFTVKPRYVKPDAGDYTEWAKECPVEYEDDFNYGLVKRKALYYPFENAYPPRWVVDERAVNDDEFKTWAQGCPDGGLDLDAQPETHTVKCKSIAWATGWQPYDANNLDLLAYGKHTDIVTNVQFERIAAPNGPTGGKVQKPSDGSEPKKIAFVQCAGSRDENHLPFCSGICCAASLKQASYVLESLPEAEVHMFYIDVRTPGRLEDFYQDRQDVEKIKLHRGKVAKVEPNGDSLKVTAENTLTGKLMTDDFDMVVLATGMQPATSVHAPDGLELDENGFAVQTDEPAGIYGVGTNVRPLGVAETLQDATGAAMKALLMARRS
ncbi:FAD-dependent oxidoreductase [bacterium]|nr:FAD-dependent oxidoreductase [bacterium]